MAKKATKAADNIFYKARNKARSQTPAEFHAGTWRKDSTVELTEDKP